MSYQVLARKWRPQNFDDVVFQEHVSRTLKNSIDNKRIPHAFLFSGPRGVGKTTMARILAKALNCKTGPVPSPCDACENCLEIRRGNAFDVIEIDGASNRGIESIRELRENVNSAPLKSRYKIYIIDEVHMLTKEAFNALLKTLEEPPPHVVFIFATTEIHQVPETILSRCQKFFFKKISVDSIVNHLRKIISAENFNSLNDTVLYSIARASEGSMRDAQSLLDQIQSFSGDSITNEDILAILGIVPVSSYLLLTSFIVSGDVKSVIEEIDRVISLGADIPRYCAGFADVIRSMRLIKNGVDIRNILGSSADEYSKLKESVEKFSDEELSILFKISSGLQNELRFSSNERISVEMALLDMCSIKNTPSLSAILQKLENPSVSEYSGEEKKKSLPADSDNISSRSDHNFDPSPVSQDDPHNSPITDEIESTPSLSNGWESLLLWIKENRQYLYFKLQEAKTSYKGNELNIEYPEGEDFEQYGSLLDRDDIEFIKEEMKKSTGLDISIKVGVYTSKKDTAEHYQPEEVPPPDAEMLQKPEVEEIEVLNPVAEKIKDMFHGQIVENEEEE